MPGEPLWINYDPVSAKPEYDANEMRQAMALALMYDGRAVGARQGVRPGGPPIVSLNGSVITVQPHLSLIDPGLTTTQGPYWVAIPVAENPVGGPLAAADATNPRRDIVVARVYDHDQDASGLRLSRSEYRAGAAGPTPSLPAALAGEILLATIDVPKSGNGAPVVTNVYPYTVASGGILPVRAAGDIASAVAGRYRDRLDTRTLERDNGAGAWETMADPAAFAVWKTYTPVWNANATAPSLGNGSITGRYMQMGKTVFVYTSLTLGSTSTVGSGAYGLSLPVTPRGGQLLDAWVEDSSTSGRWAGVAKIISGQAGGDNMRIVASTVTVTQSGPMAWASGDNLTIQGVYEAI